MTEVIHDHTNFWPLPLYLAVAEAPIAGWQAIGKVAQNITFEAKELPEWELADWGYGKNKIKQLDRNYIDEQEFERVRAVLKKRGLARLRPNA